MSTEPDVVYFSRGGRDLRVDVYRPEGPSRRTAVLVLHGGGWRRGDRSMVGSRCEALAAVGFTAVGVEYRLLGDALWPAALHDVKAAVRWARREAGGLGIDPARIVLQGHSAGAHLSLVAAGSVAASDIEADPQAEAQDQPVAAVVAYHPPVSFTVDIPMPDVSGPPGPERKAQMAALRRDGRAPAGTLLGRHDAQPGRGVRHDDDLLPRPLRDSAGGVRGGGGPHQPARRRPAVSTGPARSTGGVP